MIVSTAPGRCGILGNPSDMYGGSVISISTKERARCELAIGDVGMIQSGDQNQTLRNRDDLDLRGDRLDILRAVMQYFHDDLEDVPIRLSVSTDIPMQAGMAGSTALMVSVVGALNAQFKWGMNPWIIAETARKIENRVMKVLCGHQDQHMAVFGGVNHMIFLGKQSLEQRDDEPLATVEPLAPYLKRIPLLCAHTGLKHHSGSVHRSPRERWLAGEKQVVDSFHRIADLPRLGKRALLSGDWKKLGELMNENQSIISSLGGSGEVNDRLIYVALDAGAYGAKLAGAGGGGTILVLTDHPRKVGNALLKAGADSLMYPQPSPGLNVRIVSE